MTILSSLKTRAGIEQDVDSVGSGFRILESGLYDLEIKLAFLSTSKGGALALNLEAVTSAGATVRQQMWMTSGTAKGCLNYYVDKTTGKEKYLPGFNTANALALLTVGKEIGDLEPEDKVINQYNRELGKEAPTKVQMYTDLIGKTITAGIVKQTVDKTALNESTGSYDPTGETRDENEIDKFFRARDGLTVAEIIAGETESSFRESWAAKNAGVTRNRAKGLDGASVGVAGAPVKAAAPKQSLFS